MGESWPLFLFLAGLIAAWSMLILGVMRSMLSKCIGDLEEKISGISGLGKDLQRLEREFLEMKATLPLDYVRKEDHMRFELVLNTKLDRLHQDMMTAINVKEKTR